MPSKRKENLVVRGAREHNLKGVSCDLPRDRLVVITGPSGSGKTSLAFDTIYAEGQRRYVESLSAYARQFLARLPKPNVESIEGLSPAIAIEQRSLGRNPRSTVGTVTEVADYLRLLFARAGVPHSPTSGKPLRAHTAQEIVDIICQRPEGTRISLLAPIARARRGDLQAEFAALRREGFVRVLADHKPLDLSDDLALDPTAPHDLDAIIDRIVVRPGIASRVTDSVELALRVGNGTLLVDDPASGEPKVLSERLISWEEGFTFPPLEPALFSFNSPLGSCPSCDGLGVISRIDEARIIPDGSLSLRQGAVVALGRRGSPAAATELDLLVTGIGVNPDTPWAELPEEKRQAILMGTNDGTSRAYEGVLPRVQRLLSSADSVSDEDIEEGALSPADLGRLAAEKTCPECGGARLRPEALAVRVGGKNIAELCAHPLPNLRGFMQQLLISVAPSEPVRAICEPVLRAVIARLGFLTEVGVGYLTLDRPVHTLSGGEGQRIRLATQLGSSLVGVLYVLDEPSIGLHPKDNRLLLNALRKLVDGGNSVIVVEHDRDTILAADYLVDMGPGAGEHGGQIVAQGTPQQVLRDSRSITAPYLSARRAPALPIERKPRTQDALRIVGARLHNLKNVSVDIPIGLLTAVTGLSGSGKSTLIVDTLLAAGRAHFSNSPQPSASCDAIDGFQNIDKIVNIDQQPIGRTPRSNPASYTGIMAHLRELFAALPDARARGYRAGRFSFNVKGGRCETCQGEGVQRIEMHFLPDAFVTCAACNGARYNRETLEVRYRGHSVAQILDLDVDQAGDLFASVPRISEKLSALRSVGLGYLKLGQTATTLSGGEAQRVKLATEFARPATGRTLYVLDEPTTGLHFSDVEVLLKALMRLRDAHNSVVVIEHNLDLIAYADWVIDLGPEGGPLGGEVVATGTPEELTAVTASHTGRHLQKLLPSSSRRVTPRRKPR